MLAWCKKKECILFTFSLSPIDYIFHYFPRLSSVAWAPPMQQPPAQRPARVFLCARATSHGVSSSPIGCPQAPHLISLPLSGGGAAQQQAAGSSRRAAVGGQPFVRRVSWPSQQVRTPGRSPHVSGSLRRARAPLDPTWWHPTRAGCWLRAISRLPALPALRRGPVQWVCFRHADRYDARRLCSMTRGRTRLVGSPA